MATDWAKLKVVDLKAELKRRGLAQAGLKQELVNRLIASDEEPEPPAAADDDGAAQVTDEQAEAEAEPEPDADVEPQTKPTAAEQTEVAVAEHAHTTSLTANGVHQSSEAASEESTEKRSREDANASQLPEADSKSETLDSREQILPNDSSSDKSTLQPDVPLSQNTAADSSVPSSYEIQKDAQSRKRRSPSPSLLSQDIRKRARYNSSGDATRPDITVDSEPTHELNGAQADHGTGPASAADASMPTPPSHVEPTAAESKQAAPIHPPSEEEEAKGGRRPAQEESAQSVDVPMTEYELSRQGIAVHDSAVPAQQHAKQDADEAMEEDEREVASSIHPATTALYIKNFMRPLRPAAVQEYLAELAAPRGRSPDASVVLDFYLDQIRTHAFVVFASVAAASRARSALHDKVWPDESNRKVLWVDYVPPGRVREWVEREQAEGGGGRAGLDRWEVFYDVDKDGYVTATHELVSPLDTLKGPQKASLRAARAESPPPPIPTGPSRAFPAPGVEGAPLGPRADRPGARAAAPPSAPSATTASRPADGWVRSRAQPAIMYRPVQESLARRRIDNMRSFLSKKNNKDSGRDNAGGGGGQLNRYTFESGDGFVDRGREVFIGIRPPHRERERQRDLAAGVAPRRAVPPGGASHQQQSGPPPPPRGDRYFGSRDNDFVPRSRLDGMPLPTYNGPPGGRSGRWRRGDSYRDRRY